MKLKIENIGPINKADIKINDLTIICGENNVGKTYINYTIYGVLNLLLNDSVVDSKNLDQETLDLINTNVYNVEDLFSDVTVLINGYLKKNIGKLSKYFVMQLEDFKNSKVTLTGLDSKSYENIEATIKTKYYSIHLLDGTFFIDIDETQRGRIPNNLLIKELSKNISRILMADLIPRIFPITSERTGVALFYKDLDINRSQLIEYIQNNDKINVFELINSLSSKYMRPITHNISFIRDFYNISRNKSFLHDEKCKLGKKIIKEWKNFISGNFKYMSNELLFVDKKNKKPAHIYNSSSSIKSLLILDLYIMHYAQLGDLLLIDEPELNLHPKKQVEFSRIMGLLINAGIKIVITTHSDYILREISHLISLNRDSPNIKKIKKKFKYDQDSLLESKNVSLYELCSDGTSLEVSINADGFERGIFDNIINIQNEITYNLM